MIEEQPTKTHGHHFYDAWSPVYTWLRDLGRDGHEDKSLLIDSLIPFEDDDVLDVGTGPGVYALRIATTSPDSRIIGIDISPTFVEIASKRATEKQAENLKFQLGNIESLEFADEQFSKVICAGVLSVIHDRESAVREMGRVLKPGGRLAVREPTRSQGALSQYFAKRPKESRLRRFVSGAGLMFGHFSPDFMTEDELRHLFNSSGLTEVIFRQFASDLIVIATK
jgi:ubiquinone/menaquinone biosynthesis C-methylase UbiE